VYLYLTLYSILLYILHLREITFILADCFAIDTLAYTAIMLLSTKCVQNEILPRVTLLNSIIKIILLKTKTL
jgi:hypothetical protein